MPYSRLKKLSCLGLVSCFIAGFPASSHAAGFYIQEQSVSSLGAAFSGSVSNLGDPSTIFFNPAGLTKLEGIQIQAGINVLVPRMTLTDTGSTLTGTGNGGNPYDPTPVPNAFISYEIGNCFWAGLGVTAPSPVAR